MTPKEKAKELVGAFMLEIIREEITTADVNIEREEYRCDVAKRCAIVCVDEIIKMELSPASLLEYGANYIKPTHYYSLVKKEIKKL